MPASRSRCGGSWSRSTRQPGAGVAPTIDWAGSFPEVAAPACGYAVETGDPDHPVLLDFRGTPLVGVAAEHVVLQIADNVFVSGAFSFRMGEVETVDVVSGRSAGRHRDLQVKTIKVGAEGVSVFLGDGLADYDIDDDIATYMSSDTRRWCCRARRSATSSTARSTGSSRRRADLARSDPAARTIRTRSVWRPVAANYLAGETPRGRWSGRRSGSGTRRPGPIGCSSGRTRRSRRRARCRRRSADYTGARLGRAARCSITATAP